MPRLASETGIVQVIGVPWSKHSDDFPMRDGHRSTFFCVGVVVFYVNPG